MQVLIIASLTSLLTILVIHLLDTWKHYFFSALLIFLLIYLLLG